MYVQASDPSIEPKVAGRICKDRVIRSQEKYEGVNYFVLTMSPAEKWMQRFRDYLQEERTSNEEKPPSKQSFTEEEKRLILVCIIQPLVKLVFNSHKYNFNNQIYHQQG